MLAVNEFNGRGGGKTGGVLTRSAGTLAFVSAGFPKVVAGRGGGAIGGAGAAQPPLYGMPEGLYVGAGCWYGPPGGTPWPCICVE